MNKYKCAYNRVFLYILQENLLYDGFYLQFQNKTANIFDN